MMKKKTIAILGVDGSGKSTLIERVSAMLGDTCVVQYMGFRSFEDPRVEAFINDPHPSKWATFRNLFLTYRCFWKRYTSAVNTEKIVLFDRYVHEIFINSHGIYRIIYTLLYKWLFPMPDKKVYLHCSAEESMRRKSDIENPDVFRAMKLRFDGAFLGDRHCLCVNTEELAPIEQAERVYNYIISD